LTQVPREQELLNIKITVEGEKLVIDGLNQFVVQTPNAIRRALERTAKGVMREAFSLLSGAGAKGVTKEVTGKSGGKYNKFQKQNIPAGGYPVPVRTGHLRRSLDWLKPGATKETDVGVFTAGSNEVVVYDSAQYARVIHEGTGSSTPHGPRRYLTDALENFNSGSRISQIIEEEIQKEVDKFNQ